MLHCYQYNKASLKYSIFSETLMLMFLYHDFLCMKVNVIHKCITPIKRQVINK